MMMWFLLKLFTCSETLLYQNVIRTVQFLPTAMYLLVIVSALPLTAALCYVLHCSTICYSQLLKAMNCYGVMLMIRGAAHVTHTHTHTSVNNNNNNNSICNVPSASVTDPEGKDPDPG